MATYTISVWAWDDDIEVEADSVEEAKDKVRDKLCPPGEREEYPGGFILTTPDEEPEQ